MVLRVHIARRFTLTCKLKIIFYDTRDQSYFRAILIG